MSVSGHFKNMNTTQFENGNSQIPDVPELVIEEGLSPEEITAKITEHNQAVADYKEKVDSANKELYVRTKKAEGFEFKDGKWVKPEANGEQKPTVDTSKNSDKDGLTQADLITVIKNDIPEEDLPEVLGFAKYKGITVAEALKSPIIKAMLAENSEARNVAEGSNTQGGRRGSGQLSDKALLDAAAKGSLPESAEDMARLSILQRKSRK